MQACKQMHRWSCLRVLLEPRTCDWIKKDGADPQMHDATEHAPVQSSRQAANWKVDSQNLQSVVALHGAGAWSRAFLSRRSKGLRRCAESDGTVPTARGRALPLRPGQLTSPAARRRPTGTGRVGFELDSSSHPIGSSEYAGRAGVGVCRPGAGLCGATSRRRPTVSRCRPRTEKGEQAGRARRADRVHPEKGASSFFARAVAVCPRPAPALRVAGDRHGSTAVRARARCR